MRPLGDLVARARTCVPCHVGDGTKDVNHDLIAAGHPPLRFEFSTYLTNMTKHWDPIQERVGRPDFEARVWLAGQAVVAQAALELLEHRAVEVKVWPELAEYYCFGCHHNLTGAGWRGRGTNILERRPGNLRWQDWYPGMVRVLARQPSYGALKPTEEVLTELQALMQRPYPNGAQVARKARAAANQLEAALPSLLRERKPEDLQALFIALGGEGGIEPSKVTWDQAAQSYLALAALHRALEAMGQADRKRRNFLKSLEQKLQFPRGYNSPRF